MDSPLVKVKGGRLSGEGGGGVGGEVGQQIDGGGGEARNIILGGQIYEHWYIKDL